MANELTYTGDRTKIYGLALSRDSEGNLSDIHGGLSYEEAKTHYDNFRAAAILEITFNVLSSVDGSIQPRKD